MNIFFPSSSLQDVSSLILFPLCATSVVEVGGKFTATSVNRTSGTGGQICRWCHLQILEKIRNNQCYFQELEGR
jgi:hypothetical protein